MFDLISMQLRNSQLPTTADNLPMLIIAVIRATVARATATQSV